MQPPEMLIVGAGPVGLALALALRDAGLAVAVADARNREAAAADARVLALAHGSRLVLERLGAWDAIPATPIAAIHVSQEGGFGRTLLRAADYGLPALGYVTSAGELAAALLAAVDAAGIPVMHETEVVALAPGRDSIVATLGGNGAGRHGATRSASLVACAEGGLREGEADVIGRDYRQQALIAQVEPQGGHRNTAFERFTPDGPVALLPFGERYALVHVTSPERADELLALDETDYLERLQGHVGSRVRLNAVTDRLRYPLGLRYRREPVGQRTVWLGNAAQTLHPVAGQGFNLALRDVWCLAETLLRHPGDPGAAATLMDYAAGRRFDRFATIRFTDTLTRLFSNDLVPLRHARGAALFALDVIAPLRHFLAKRMIFGARAWP